MLSLARLFGAMKDRESKPPCNAMLPGSAIFARQNAIVNLAPEGQKHYYWTGPNLQILLDCHMAGQTAQQVISGMKIAEEDLVREIKVLKKKHNRIILREATT
jgi:hypothetical protein